jgi:hypothetical protein
MLLNKHRNSLVELIKVAGFDIRRFKHSEEKIVIDVRVYEAFTVSLDDSSVSFHIVTEFRDEHWSFLLDANSCFLTKEGPTGMKGGWSNWFSDFKDVEKRFQSWLNSTCTKYFSYRAEQEEDRNLPDLWSSPLDLSPRSAAHLEALQNTSFSVEDQSRISESLNEVLSEVQSRDILVEDQLRLLRQELEYLREASRRLSRKDFVMATAGALMSCALATGLGSDAATQLFQIAAEKLQWIWIIHPPLLGP